MARTTHDAGVGGIASERAFCPSSPHHNRKSLARGAGRTHGGRTNVTAAARCASTAAGWAAIVDGAKGASRPPRQSMNSDYELQVLPPMERRSSHQFRRSSPRHCSTRVPPLLSVGATNAGHLDLSLLKRFER